MEKANIIIGTDLSDNSNTAIEAGIVWANQLKCEATVMHIHERNHIENVGVLFPEFEQQSKDLAKMLNESIEKKLNKKVESWQSKISDLHTLVVYGDKIKKFIEITKEKKCKLLVISLDSKEDDSFLFGKIVGKLIRLSPVPVLIVKDERAIRPKTISFPFAFQGLSQDAASWVEVISETFDSKVYPIHILDEKMGIDNSNESFNDLADVELLYEGVEPFYSMKSSFAGIKPHGRLQELSVKGTSKQKPRDALLGALKTLNSDLIVMGSSGKAGLERLYLGSFCEYILRNTPSSILITKKF